mgnify:CR=1 FL=1
MVVVGLAIVAGAFVYEHTIVRPHDLSRLNRAFFSVNGFIGIALFVAWSWLRHDARERGIPATPYRVASALLGSPAVLAYLIHRELRARRQVAVSAS